MPVVGDSILLSDSNEQGTGEPETASQLTWSNRMKVFEVPKYTIGCQIVPELVPDSLIQLKLSEKAIVSLISYLGNLVQKMKAEKFEQTLEVCNIIKLFLRLNNDPETRKSLGQVSKQDRQLLLKNLSAISTFTSEEEKESDNEILYTTSLVENAIAIHLRE